MAGTKLPKESHPILLVVYMKKLKFIALVPIALGVAFGAYWGYHRIYGAEEIVTVRALDLKRIAPGKDLQAFLAGFQAVVLPLRFKSESVRAGRWNTVPREQVQRFLPGWRRAYLLSYFDLATFARKRMADGELQRNRSLGARYRVENEHGAVILDPWFAVVELSFPRADAVQIDPPRFFYLPVVGKDFVAVTYLLRATDERLRKRSLSIVLATLDRDGKPIQAVLIGESSLTHTRTGEKRIEIDTITTIDESRRIEYRIRSWNRYGHNTGTSGYEHRMVYKIKTDGRVVLTMAE
jgi:hypothetical protein